MLVSKIKPCMSQFKQLHSNTVHGSLKQPQPGSWSCYMDIFGNSAANTCTSIHLW